MIFVLLIKSSIYLDLQEDQRLVTLQHNMPSAVGIHSVEKKICTTDLKHQPQIKGHNFSLYPHAASGKPPLPPLFRLIFSPVALHDHGSDGCFADAFAMFPPAARRGWSERGPTG